LCVDLLDVTARLLRPCCLMLTCWNYTTLCDAPARVTMPPSSLSPPDSTRCEAHLAGLTLPQSWDVTSDSIAARLAEVAGRMMVRSNRRCQSHTADGPSLPEVCRSTLRAATQGLSKVRSNPDGVYEVAY
jgi:hypothetical protein